MSVIDLSFWHCKYTSLYAEYVTTVTVFVLPPCVDIYDIYIYIYIYIIIISEQAEQQDRSLL